MKFRTGLKQINYNIEQQQNTNTNFFFETPRKEYYETAGSFYQFRFNLE